MTDFSEPYILSDKNRLQEIYNLRYDSLRDHECANNFDIELISDINSHIETLDETGIHFIIQNNFNNEIAATYRLNILDTIDQLPYPGIFKPFPLPKQTPFLFYSRLVVSKKYRNNNLATKLQSKLCSFHIEKDIPFGIGTVHHLVNWLQKWGFDILGDINPRLDKNYHYGDSRAVIIHRNKIKLFDKTDTK